MPSHADLFRAWCKFRGDPEALLGAFNLSPEDLLDFTLAYADRIAQWRSLLREHAALAALDHQHAAAAKLRDTLASDNPVEARRAATALARVAAQMNPARPEPRPTNPTHPTNDPDDNLPDEPTEPAPDDPNPSDTLDHAIHRLRSTSTLSFTAAAADLAPLLTPDATLDGAPIPADARADPARLADLLAASPLARITDRHRRGNLHHDRQDCSVLIVYEYEAPAPDRFFLAARLVRPQRLAPWRIEAFSFPKTPPSS